MFILYRKMHQSVSKIYFRINTFLLIVEWFFFAYVLFSAKGISLLLLLLFHWMRLWLFTQFDARNPKKFTESQCPCFGGGKKIFWEQSRSDHRWYGVSIAIQRNSIEIRLDGLNLKQPNLITWAMMSDLLNV